MVFDNCRVVMGVTSFEANALISSVDSVVAGRPRMTYFIVDLESASKV